MESLGEANTLAAQGQAALMRGDSAQAEALLDQAQTIYRAIGDRYSQAAQIGNYGFTLLRAGNLQAAGSYLLKAADLFEALGMDDLAQRCRSAAGEGN